MVLPLLQEQFQRNLARFPNWNISASDATSWQVRKVTMPSMVVFTRVLGFHPMLFLLLWTSIFDLISHLSQEGRAVHRHINDAFLRLSL